MFYLISHVFAVFFSEFALIETIKAGSNIIIQNNNFKRSIDVVEQAVHDGVIPISIIITSSFIQWFFTKLGTPQQEMTISAFFVCLIRFNFVKI